MSTGLAAALSRSLVLIERAGRPDGIPFGEAVEAIHAVPSTASRLLRALAEAGLVARAADGRYHATPRVARLARARPDLAQEAQAEAEALAEASGEACAVFAPVPEGVRLIAKSEPPERFRYMPLGGVNRDCLWHGGCTLRAAWWDRAEATRRRAAFLAEGARKVPAPTPAPTFAAWLARLARLRRAGVLVNASDDHPGLARIAAAACAADELRAVIVLTGTAPAFAARRAILASLVRAAAQSLARNLGAAP
jgi:DNA-binding IclR family transcriptional regulator